MRTQSPKQQLALFGEAPEDDRIAKQLGVPSLDGFDSHELGSLHQRALDVAGSRKRSGSFYTPSDVVERLLDISLQPILERAAHEGSEVVAALRVIDPACGSGNFLVAAARRIERKLVELGASAEAAASAAFGDCVVGIDIDSTAVELCRSSLRQGSRGWADETAIQRQVLCADALAITTEESLLPERGRTWQQLFESLSTSRSGFDLVVGNPPFLSQLSSETARDTVYSDDLRKRLGPSVAGLTDTAVLFLLLSTAIARTDGGTVCLIQPMSLLSTRDARMARSDLLERCALESLWLCEERVFDASVQVCAPVLVRGTSSGTTILYNRRSFDPAGSSPAPAPADVTWSRLLALGKGLPDREFATDGSVRDVATATADFRDQYYGLRGCVIDDASADDDQFPPLVTSGLVDPAVVLWGERSTRFDKHGFDHPRVDLEKLTPELRKWAAERLRPKVLLATQTKVLEAVVDDQGRYLPSVPVISISAEDPSLLWKIGVLLTSPPVTLIAAVRHLGAALSSDALKLGAKDVLDLPLPADQNAWEQAAQLFRSASLSCEAAERRELLTAGAKLMCTAFGLPGDEELLSWWAERLPGDRRRQSTNA
jgi:hypothetical protein